ncbi:MAG: hypothetical protein JWP69_795 [Flaviaesturariibacter sp.]|nr:hypothetical protein [Flaviaesturariibacter sp.]
MKTIYLLLLGLLPLSLKAQSSAEKKMTPSLANKIKNATAIDSLTVIVQGDVSRQMNKARIIESYPAASIYTIRISLKDITGFLLDTGILFADLQKIAREELTTGNLDISTNKINLAHRQFSGIRGDSIVVSIKEQKFDSADIDYKNRAINSGQASSVSTTHASVMATIIGGAGNTSPFAQGAAPGAILTSANFTSLIPQPDSIYQRYKVSTQNHSYGTVIESYYGAEASAYDASAVNNPALLHVFSSGNSGTAAATSGVYSGIGGFANLTGNFKMAKNNLVVGATDSFYVVAPLSSKGPAHDGRVKPELVAFGEDGSSGAAALASGTAALVQEAYKSFHAAFPKSATVKAVLINSADDIGNPNVDYSSGFGSLNAHAALQTVMQNRIIEGAVSNGQTSSFPLAIPPGIKQVKLTLVWTDPAAPAHSLKALINNLDITVNHPSSNTIWLPWVLNPQPTTTALLQPAQRKVDTLNNIEQITLDNPVSGSYTIDIKGTRVTNSSQAFAVVYQFDTINHFLWTFPISDDAIIGGKSNVIRWETNIAGNGQLEYSTDGINWQTIASSIDLRQHYFKWIAPLTFATARLRMKFSSTPDKLSESFIISNAPEVLVGFNCPDSFLVHWSAQTVSSYQVYELGNRYLAPIATVADTFVILSKAQHPSLYYAVAPVINGKNGLRSFTVKYDAQGVECYFKSFYVQLQEEDRVTLTATIGSLYNVAAIAFQRKIGGTYQTIKTINAPSNLDFTFDDSGLQKGINYYRLQIKLANGSVITSEVVPVYYYPKLPVIVYPNPVAQNKPVNFLSREARRYTVQILDMSGRLLRTTQLRDITNVIPSNGLAKGIYVVRIISERGTIGSEKLVIY